MDQDALDDLKLARFALDHAGIGMVRLALDGRIRDANLHLAQNLGYTQEELRGLTVFDINPTLTPERWEAHSQRFKRLGTPTTFETVHQRRTGSTIPVEVTVNYVEHRGEHFFVAVARDLTEQRLAEEERQKLQAQLAHARRMDALGQLAAGVAHDFNNMLMIILGVCDLAKDGLAPDSPLKSDLSQIQQVAERSAQLTRHLLAFARLQPLAPQSTLALNELVPDIIKLHQRIIGDHIALGFQPGAELWPVRMDPGQLDQVITNIIVNARDAITGTGRIDVSTENVTVAGPTDGHHPSVPPGDYVRMTVRDTGQGMDQQTLERVFEPYFTTKPVGQGTGLGLATVFGVLAQGGGAVRIASAPGDGTTVFLYLRRAEEPDSAGLAPTRGLARGTETILVVEDDAMVLNLVRSQLESLGYTALCARSGGEAMAMMRAGGSKVDLLLTDVLMPVMNGPELARAVRAAFPAIRIIYMSGFAPEGVLRIEERGALLNKPLRLSTLAQALRDVLDGPPQR